MKIINLEQGSPEWHAFRLGKVTGTRLGSLWSSRIYTKEDVEKLLVGRNVDLKEFQKKLNEERKAQGLKSKPYNKGDIEKLLTEEDKEVLSTDSAKKLEYYQILADQVAVARDDEVFEDGSIYNNAMDRGTGLEDTACVLFADKFNKRIFSVGCCLSDERAEVINSPDRLIMPDDFKGDNVDELIELVNSGKHKITEAVEAKCLASAKHLMAFFERKTPEDYWTQKVQYFAVNPDLETLYWVFYDPRIAMLPMFVLVIKREDLGHWPETMLKYQMKTLSELDRLTIRLFDEADTIMLPAKAEKGI